MRKIVLESLEDDDDENNDNNKEKDREYKKSGGVLYMTQIENSITRALSVSNMKKMLASTITPITIPIRDHSSGLPPATGGPSYSVSNSGERSVEEEE